MFRCAFRTVSRAALKQADWEGPNLAAGDRTRRYCGQWSVAACNGPGQMERSVRSGDMKEGDCTGHGCWDVGLGQGAGSRVRVRLTPGLHARGTTTGAPGKPFHGRHTASVRDLLHLVLPGHPSGGVL